MKEFNEGILRIDGRVFPLNNVIKYPDTNTVIDIKEGTIGYTAFEDDGNIVITKHEKKQNKNMPTSIISSIIFMSDKPYIFEN